MVLYRSHAVLTPSRAPFNHLFTLEFEFERLNVHGVHTNVLKAKSSIAVPAVARPMTLSPWLVDLLPQNLVTPARVMLQVATTPRFTVPIYSFSEPPTH